MHVTQSRDAVEREEWHITVDPRSPYFSGHFPGFPIFPGVAVLEEAILRPLAIRRPRLRRLRSVRRIKFSRPIGPGQKLDVLLTVLDQPGLVDVRVVSQSQLCVSARLCFDEC